MLRPVLQVIWLASEQLCRKLLQAALPEWLGFYAAHYEPLPGAVEKQILAISPAQIDRLLRPLRVGSPKKGLSATRPSTRLRHQVPTRGDPPDTTQLGHVAVDTVAQAAGQ